MRHGNMGFFPAATPHFLSSQAKGENDGQPIDDLEAPLEASPQLCLIPGCRIVAHRQLGAPPWCKDGADRVSAGKGEGRLGWQQAGGVGSAGWEREQVCFPRRGRGTGGGFAGIRFPEQLGMI